jgi:23S rRNA pseudouridine955/2504/2580 synthase
VNPRSAFGSHRKNSSRQSLNRVEIDSSAIVYRGDGFIVVNKPAGVPTQGTPDPRRDHLFAAVTRLQQAEFGKAAYVGLHHRLDKDTSGLVLFTTERSRNLWASELFKQRQIQKTYVALSLLNGPSQAVPGEIQNHLKKHNRPQKSAVMLPVHAGGDFAHTLFHEVARREHKVWIEAKPLTGRMHQIRTHLQSAGFPIYGDPLYGGLKTHHPNLPVVFPKRLMLHAAELTFPDPSGEMLTVRAELPADMLDFWGAEAHSD